MVFLGDGQNMKIFVLKFMNMKNTEVHVLKILLKITVVVQINHYIVLILLRILKAIFNKIMIKPMIASFVQNGGDLVCLVVLDIYA